MRKAARGFTLVEIMIAMSVLTISFLGLVAAILYSTRLNLASKEATQAMRAAEQVLETLEATDFEDIFIRYNRIAGDNGPYVDPYAGGAPGTFEVLTSGQIIFGAVPAGQQTLFRPVGPGQRVGRIQFPENAAGALDETLYTSLRFEEPPVQRNLNDDPAIEPDVTATYRLLPVLVTLDFVGVGGGPRTLRYPKILVRRGS